MQKCDLFANRNIFISNIAPVLHDMTRSYRDSSWNLCLSSVSCVIDICFLFDPVNYEHTKTAWPYVNNFLTFMQCLWMMTFCHFVTFGKERQYCFNGLGTSSELHAELLLAELFSHEEKKLFVNRIWSSAKRLNIGGFYLPHVKWMRMTSTAPLWIFQSHKWIRSEK